MNDVEIEILRTGTFKDMSGKTRNVETAAMDEMVQSYSADKASAPLVFGHPNHNDPAYGWVKSLARRGNSLFARIADIPDTVKSLIDAKTYRNVSASYFPPRHSSSPDPSKHYLRHVGLLGAAAPAIPGMQAIKFAGDGSDVVTVNLAIAPETMAPGTELRGAIESMIENLERFMPRDEIMPLLGEDIRAAIEGGNDVPVTAASFAAASNAFKGAFEATIARMATMQDEAVSFAERRRRDENEATVDEAMREGRITPYLRGEILSFMNSLDDTTTVSFASEGRYDGAEATPAERFREIVAQLPKVISFAEHSAPDQSSNEGETSAARASKISAHIKKTKDERGVVLLASEAAEELGLLEEETQ